MFSPRSLFYVSLAAALAGCSSSPAVLTPTGTLPTATPVAATATPTPASSATPTATPVATSTPVATATPIATATPVATATPTATPVTSGATITSNVNPLSFLNNPLVTACSSSFSVGFRVSESSYSGSFTAVSSNTSLVTVTQNDGQDFTATQETSSNVDPNTTAVVTVKDGNGNSLALPVNFQKTCVP